MNDIYDLAFHWKTSLYMSNVSRDILGFDLVRFSLDTYSIWTCPERVHDCPSSCKERVVQPNNATKMPYWTCMDTYETRSNPPGVYQLNAVYAAPAHYQMLHCKSKLFIHFA
jgi:hypothetical protein